MPNLLSDIYMTGMEVFQPRFWGQMWNDPFTAMGEHPYLTAGTAATVIGVGLPLAMPFVAGGAVLAAPTIAAAPSIATATGATAAGSGWLGWLGGAVAGQMLEEIPGMFRPNQVNPNFQSYPYAGMPQPGMYFPRGGQMINPAAMNQLIAGRPVRMPLFMPN